MKYLTLLLIIFSLISCDKNLTKKEIIKKQTFDFLKNNLNDPNSYEFVNLELIDSVSKKDSMKTLIQLNNKKIIRNIKSIKFYNSVNSKKDRIIELKKNNKDIENQNIDLYGKLKIKKNDNEIISYTYLLKYRTKNELGASVLYEQYLIAGTNPDYMIIQIINNTDEIKSLHKPESLMSFKDQRERFKIK
ncbi:MAG: hypothetical protein COB01_09665 [Lutibacter sp.]|nr:MAG: hypothetical protein COB01_09665 [Lutibacter sp.]